MSGLIPPNHSQRTVPHTASKLVECLQFTTKLITVRERLEKQEAQGTHEGIGFGKESE